METAPVASVSRLGRFQIVLWSTLLIVSFFTTTRVVRLLGFVDVAELSVVEVLRIFWAGLRFDLLVSGFMQIPQLLHMTLNNDRWADGRSSRFQVHAGMVLFIAFLMFFASAEYFFFEEFSSRPNYIAFEYLVYPHEVLGNLRESYPLGPALLLVAAVAVVGYLLMSPMLRRVLALPTNVGRRWALFGLAAGLIGLLWLTTSRASMEVTHDRVANQVAGNGLFTFVSDAWTSNFEYAAHYPTLPDGQAGPLVAALVWAEADQPPSNPANALDRLVGTDTPRHDYNLVLVLEESLGSDFVGCLGDDRGLTPNLDRLAADGLLFDNFYATGNRTARALEATATGLPPIPTESILKRDHNTNVTTLARQLADREYQRRFIYGGRGMFDGMRTFMLGNGFEQFIEQADYSSEEFTTAWGVSDEAIFDRALTECAAMHTEGRPFFTTVLSVSNHQPYTYPEGRIDLRASAQKRTHAVKYADYALGRFIDDARGRDWFDKTVFVILGDHGARVYGAEMFPVKSYRIPVLVLAPNITPGTRCSTLASSLDIPPTILGLLGGAYRSCFFGRDALNIDPTTAYALMQHNHDLAMLQADNTLTMLRLREPPAAYRLDPSTFKLIEQTTDHERCDTITAIFQLADEMYYADRYAPRGTQPAR